MQNKLITTTLAFIIQTTTGAAQSDQTQKRSAGTLVTDEFLVSIITDCRKSCKSIYVGTSIKTGKTLLLKNPKHSTDRSFVFENKSTSYSISYDGRDLGRLHIQDNEKVILNERGAWSSPLPHQLANIVAEKTVKTFLGKNVLIRLHSLCDMEQANCSQYRYYGTDLQSGKTLVINTGGKKTYSCQKNDKFCEQHVYEFTNKDTHYVISTAQKGYVTVERQGKVILNEAGSWQ